MVGQINAGESSFKASRSGDDLIITAFKATALPALAVTGSTATKTETLASSGWATEGSGNFDGAGFVSVSVDGSDPQSIDIAAGDYTGTELAAEMTRQLNSKFGDERS